MGIGIGTADQADQRCRRLGHRHSLLLEESTQLREGAPVLVGVAISAIRTPPGQSYFS